MINCCQCVSRLCEYLNSSTSVDGVSYIVEGVVFLTDVPGVYNKPPLKTQASIDGNKTEVPTLIPLVVVDPKTGEVR